MNALEVVNTHAICAARYGLRRQRMCLVSVSKTSKLLVRSVPKRVARGSPHMWLNTPSSQARAASRPARGFRFCHPIASALPAMLVAERSAQSALVGLADGMLSVCKGSACMCISMQRAVVGWTGGSSGGHWRQQSCSCSWCCTAGSKPLLCDLVS